MTTLLYAHPVFGEHDTGPGHPEQPARAAAVLEGLSGMALERRDAPEVAAEAVARAHGPDFLPGLLARAPEQGLSFIDTDTVMSPASPEAALRAAGAVVAAVEAVVAGAAANAFCAVRPPGHHAERRQAMGFCLLSNAAIGALHALTLPGIERVAVLDFDVHHGNGSQDILAPDPRVFFASSHQMPLYPGTGAPHEHGPHGTVRNGALAPGAGSFEFRAMWERQLLPAAERFAPDLVIISAGFDAHRADPLASIELETEDFAWITGAICELAEATAGGRVVSTLEGGYDLASLAASAAAHVGELRERGA